MMQMTTCAVPCALPSNPEELHHAQKPCHPCGSCSLAVADVVIMSCKLTENHEQLNMGQRVIMLDQT